MPEPERFTKSFDNYRLEYGITNPNGKDLARADVIWRRDRPWLIRQLNAR